VDITSCFEKRRKKKLQSDGVMTDLNENILMCVETRERMQTLKRDVSYFYWDFQLPLGLQSDKKWIFLNVPNNKSQCTSKCQRAEATNQKQWKSKQN
jgi:hypothetical protein